MFAVVPNKNCPHLGAIEPLPEEGINHKVPCVTCQDEHENWICLTCYKVCWNRNFVEF